MKRHSFCVVASSIGSHLLKWRVREMRKILVAGFFLAIAAAVLVGSQLLQPASAQSQVESDLESAFESVVLELSTNRAYAGNPELIFQAAESTFSMLRPDIANREMRKDPAYLEVEAIARIPSEEDLAERMKDPEFERVMNAAREALTRGQPDMKEVLRTVESPGYNVLQRNDSELAP